MTETPLLFLDFDGVLNSHAAVFLTGPVGLLGLYAMHVEPLNTIVERSGAMVVISSTWRLFHPLDELRELLRKAGYRHDNVIGVTPDLNRDGDGVRRGHEIEAWLDERAWRGPFVILDDDTDMAHHLPRLVRTDFATGLEARHVDQVLAMLNAGDRHRVDAMCANAACPKGQRRIF